jgi:hypothetical protein
LKNGERNLSNVITSPIKIINRKVKYLKTNSATLYSSWTSYDDKRGKVLVGMVGGDIAIYQPPNQNLALPYSFHEIEASFQKKVWRIWWDLSTNYTIKENYFYQASYTTGTVSLEPNTMLTGYGSYRKNRNTVFGPVTPVSQACNVIPNFESRSGYLSSPQFNGAWVWY